MKSDTKVDYKPLRNRLTFKLLRSAKCSCGRQARDLFPERAITFRMDILKGRLGFLIRNRSRWAGPRTGIRFLSSAVVPWSLSGQSHAYFIAKRSKKVWFLCEKGLAQASWKLV